MPVKNASTVTTPYNVRQFAITCTYSFRNWVADSSKCFFSLNSDYIFLVIRYIFLIGLKFSDYTNPSFEMHIFLFSSLTNFLLSSGDRIACPVSTSSASSSFASVRLGECYSAAKSPPPPCSYVPLDLSQHPDSPTLSPSSLRTSPWLVTHVVRKPLTISSIRCTDVRSGVSVVAGIGIMMVSSCNQ